jgi:hypothetical protein
MYFVIATHHQLLYQLSRLQTSKFSMTSFYVTSFICQVHVCICNKFFYDKFSYDKFYLLVWMCQKKVFIAAMTEKL